ncbi:hypothetical protein [Acinetobacter sp. GG2]|uniref:hypothetical protein n=1 Tax=Acinetobacter sp. GG2 TaxID=651305 RepID=UPI0003023710|nr:hypothetical protein [Acinetobacter sp. GG2]
MIVPSFIINFLINMKQNLKILFIFSIAYLMLLALGILVFFKLFGLTFTDTSVLSNIFVWSATLFAPITAFFIFEGWKTQHNKSVERSLAEESSLNLNKVSENLGQIYFAMYLNEITHPEFYPINNRTLPEFILKSILDLQKEAINCTTSLDKDLKRLGRKNAKLKSSYEKYNQEFNNLHKNLFYFFDLKMQGKLPDLDEDSAKTKFIELYDHFHSYKNVCDELDTILDDIIFI